MYNKRFSKLIIFMLTFLLLFSNVSFFTANDNLVFASEGSAQSRDLKVHFIDVGQGDSIFIQLPDGTNALIDAGIPSKGQIVIDYIKSTGTTKLDYVFGTHAHNDHVGGMPNVINNFDIGKFYMPLQSDGSFSPVAIVDALGKKGLSITDTNDDTTIIDKKGLALKCFSPSAMGPLQFNDLNNNSMILKLHSNGHNFLFTGDAEYPAENGLLHNNKDIKVDVLKVGHHGSGSSTSQQFLDKVNPKFAVISCGKNNQYGHPHKDVLSRLNNKNVKTYRTDNDGTIVMTSNGKDISVTKNGVTDQSIKPTSSTKPVVKPKPKASAPKPATKKTTAPAKSKPKVVPAPKAKQQVLVTPTGKRYHIRKCGRGNYTWTSLNNAKSRGLTPCNKCY